MGYIFVSYSSKDRDFATQLAQDLNQAGYETWLDQGKITGREPYWDEIQGGVEGCSHFLFIISPDSILRDSGARKELYHAASLKPSPLIIPVMARATPYDKLPILISPGELQIHDFVGRPYDVMLQHVLTALAADAAAEPTPPRARSYPPQSHVQRRKPLATLAVAVVGVILIGAIIAVLLNNRPPTTVIANTTTLTATGIPIAAATLQTPASATNAPTNTIAPAATLTHTFAPSASPTITITPTNIPASATATAQNVIAWLPPNVNALGQVKNVWDGITLRHPGLSKIRTYDKTIDAASPMRFVFFWCGDTESRLEKMLSVMSVSLLIDDIEIKPSSILVYDENTCRRWATILSGWHSGTKVVLEVRYTFSEQVFDGTSTIEAGTYAHRLTVTVL
jgi:hypothetical protein